MTKKTLTWNIDLLIGKRNVIKWGKLGKKKIIHRIFSKICIFFCTNKNLKSWTKKQHLFEFSTISYKSYLICILDDSQSTNFRLTLLETTFPVDSRRQNEGIGMFQLR